MKVGNLQNPPPEVDDSINQNNALQDSMAQPLRANENTGGGSIAVAPKDILHENGKNLEVPVVLNQDEIQRPVQAVLDDEFGEDDGLNPSREMEKQVKSPKEGDKSIFNEFAGDFLTPGDEDGKSAENIKVKQSTLVRAKNLAIKGKGVVERVTEFISNIQFFTYDDENLDIYDDELTGKNQSKKTKISQYVKKIGKNLITVCLFLYIFLQYVQTLGDEQSQALTYVSSTSLSYDITEVPRLLPAHHFSFFDTDAVINRIKCDLYNVEEECYKKEKRRCLVQGLTTIDYETCMIKLKNSLEQDPIEFCRNHYNNLGIWTDQMSPRYLQYYLRKHDCLKEAGLEYGREFCQDQFDNSPEWGIKEKWNCFTQNGVEFAKEFCDTQFTGDSAKLMLCYGTKGIKRDSTVCVNTYNTTTEQIQCFEDNAIVDTKQYCDLKMLLDTDNGVALATRIVNQKSCYTLKAKIVVNKAFCDSQYNFSISADVEKLYDDCYVLLDEPISRDIRYCELLYRESKEKFYCTYCTKNQPTSIQSCIASPEPDVLTNVGADYCYFKYPWGNEYEQLFSCLEQEDCYFRLKGDELTACLALKKGFPLASASQICVKKYQYFEELAITKNEAQSKITSIREEKNECLFTNAGIKNLPDLKQSCNKYLLMPRGQSFLKEIIPYTAIQISKNIEKNIVNFTHFEEDELNSTIVSDDNKINFFNDENIFVIGSHNSFYRKDLSSAEDAFYLWFLESNRQDFLEDQQTRGFWNIEDIDHLTQTFGHFLITNSTHRSQKELAKLAFDVYKREEKFYNPLLDDADISLNVLGDIDDSSDGPSSNELLTGVLGELTSEEIPGEMLQTLENFLVDASLPQDDSILFKFQDQLNLPENVNLTFNEIFLNSPNNTKLGQLRTDVFKLAEDPLFAMLPSQNLTAKSLRLILRDMRETSGAINSLYNSYQNTDKDSLIRKLVAELEKVVEAGTVAEVTPADVNSVTRRLQEVDEQVEIKFNELLGKLADMPLFSGVFSQLGYLSNLPPALLQEQALLQPFAQSMISDLGIDAILKEAQANRVAELILLELAKDTQTMILDQVEMFRTKTLTGQLINEFLYITDIGFYQEDQSLFHQTFKEVLEVQQNSTSIEEMMESYSNKPTLGALIIEIEEVLMHYKSLALLERNVEMPIIQNLTRFLREDVNTIELMNVFDQLFENEIGQLLQNEMIDLVEQNLNLTDFYNTVMQTDVFINWFSEVMSSNPTTFAENISSQPISESFELDLYFLQPKGKTLIFSELLSNLDAYPIISNIISEFKEITSAKFNMLSQEGMSALFNEFFEVIEESPQNSPEEVAELLLGKENTRKLILEIEKVIQNDEKMFNLLNERKWSPKLAQQLYDDLSEQEDTADLMESLTEIFKKEVSSKIMDEVNEVLDQQLNFQQFVPTLMTMPISGELVNEVIESGIMSSSHEEFMNKLKEREISSKIMVEFDMKTITNDLLLKYETADELFSIEQLGYDLMETPTAGKLISEFFEITHDELIDRDNDQSKQWVVKNLTDELQYAIFSEENTTNSLDFWIMQNETFKVIEEIEKVIKLSNLNDSLSLVDFDLIFSQFKVYSGSQEVVESILDLEDIQEANKMYLGVRDALEKEEMYPWQIADYIKNSSMVDELFDELAEQFLKQNLETFMIEHIIEYLQKTPYAGKLLSEYNDITMSDIINNSTEWLTNNLTSEIKFAESQEKNQTEMIDLWIMQDSTFAVIEDIMVALDHAQSENGEYITKSIITNEIIQQILFELESKNKQAEIIIQSIEESITKLPKAQELLSETSEIMNQEELQVQDLPQIIFEYTYDLFSEILNEFKKKTMTVKDMQAFITELQTFEKVAKFIQEFYEITEENSESQEWITYNITEELNMVTMDEFQENAKLDDQYSDTLIDQWIQQDNTFELVEQIRLASLNYNESIEAEFIKISPKVIESILKKMEKENPIMVDSIVKSEDTTQIFSYLTEGDLTLDVAFTQLSEFTDELFHQQLQEFMLPGDLTAQDVTSYIKELNSTEKVNKFINEYFEITPENKDDNEWMYNKLTESLKLIEDQAIDDSTYTEILNEWIQNPLASSLILEIQASSENYNSTFYTGATSFTLSSEIIIDLYAQFPGNLPSQMYALTQKLPFTNSFYKEIESIEQEYTIAYLIEKAQEQLEQFVEEYISLLTQKFIKKEGVQKYLEMLMQTQNAGKLLSEYFELEDEDEETEYLTYTIQDELSDVYMYSTDYNEILDEWILQPETLSVIQDILQVSELTDISSIYVSSRVIEQILNDFTSQDEYSAMVVESLKNLKDGSEEAAKYIEEFNETPLATDVIKELGEIREKVFEQYVDSLFELDGEYLTTQNVTDYLAELKKTDNAGKLISEYYELTPDDMENTETAEQWMSFNLSSELIDALFQTDIEDEDFTNLILNKWIQQPSTFAVISDIQNVNKGFDISTTKLSYDVIESILNDLTSNKQTSMISSIKSLNESEIVSMIQEEIMSFEHDYAFIEILEELKDLNEYMFIEQLAIFLADTYPETETENQELEGIENLLSSFIEDEESFLTEDQNEPFEPNRRRLAEAAGANKLEYQIGEFHFEGKNLIVGHVPGKNETFKLAIEDYQTLNISVYAPGEKTKPMLHYQYLLGSDYQNLVLERETFKNLTLAKAYHETIPNKDLLPNLDCHFSGSGDETSSPWIKFMLKEPTFVLNIKIFNFQNGQFSSLLEDSTIYVGNSTNEQVCALLGPIIPKNEFISITCEDANSGPKNVFGDANKKVYGGTWGDYIRIENNKYTKDGVMTLCDVEITANVINEEIETEINDNLAKCEVVYQECRDNFTNTISGDVQEENLANCYERYSFNKTGRFCVDQSEKIISDQIHYKLKNKYECLTQISQMETSQEVGSCLNKYYDYEVEKCLTEFEKNYTITYTKIGTNTTVKNIGFIGPGNKTQNVSDPMSSQSQVWNVYSNTSISAEEYNKLLVELVSLDNAANEFTFASSVILAENEYTRDYFIGNISDYLCKRSEMTFSSNPYNDTAITKRVSANEIVLNMYCEVFQSPATEGKREQTVIHHFMPPVIDVRSQFQSKEIKNQLFINRTDLNQQYFKIKYTDDLAFLDVEKSELYVHKQDPQWPAVQAPLLPDQQSFVAFQQMNNTFKLSESANHSIGESQAQLTNLKSEPFNFIHHGTANKTARHLWGIPIMFINVNETQIQITPENDIREPVPLTTEEMKQSDFSNFMNLKFLFIEQQFYFTYVGIDDLFADLGGVSKLAEELLGNLAPILIWLYMIDLAFMIQKKHRFDQNIFKIKRLTQRLPLYKQAAEKLMKEFDTSEDKGQLDPNTPEDKDKKEKLQANIDLIQKLIDDWDECPDKFKSKKIKKSDQDEKKELEAAQKAYKLEKHIEQLDNLDSEFYEAGKEFIELDTYELQDEFDLNKKIYDIRVKTDIFRLFMEIKKAVSFMGIFGMSEGIENLDLQMKKYKKTMVTAFKMMFKNQDVILEQQQKRKKKEKSSMGKVQLLKKNGKMQDWTRRQDEQYVERELQKAFMLKQ